MPKRNKSLFSQLDLWLVLSALLTFAVGLVAITSSAQSLGSYRYIVIQAAAFFIGALLLVLLVRLDYDLFGQLGIFIYLLSALMLLVVLFIGTGAEEVGTKGWIRFGPVGIQPSELAKIGFIISFAKHVDAVRENINRPSVLLLLCLHAGLLIGLILLQPD
ncbi:MAG: rod shape-determining protein RodA, partial [Ruminococcaceae bacterium]|nr:rod shape-determining protein RodA [Oscillospiraceae bacterium]